MVSLFEAYAAGMPPRKIALMRVTEGVPGPRNRGWGTSTINGNASRGVGIINNRAYIGKLVWNQRNYQKEPRTGKRLSRPNDASAVIEKDAPPVCGSSATKIGTV